jgi:hypothetical protein
VLARLAGFEPATRCLEGSRSLRLSYRRPVPHCARSRSHVGHATGWSRSRRQATVPTARLCQTSGRPGAHRDPRLTWLGYAGETSGSWTRSRAGTRASRLAAPKIPQRWGALLVGVSVTHGIAHRAGQSCSLDPFDCREPGWCAVVVVSRLNPVWSDAGDIPSMAGVERRSQLVLTGRGGLLRLAHPGWNVGVARRTRRAS